MEIKMIAEENTSDDITLQADTLNDLPVTDDRADDLDLSRDESSACS
jgi:hypothetical protein